MSLPPKSLPQLLRKVRLALEQADKAFCEGGPWLLGAISLDAESDVRHSAANRDRVSRAVDGIRDLCGLLHECELALRKKKTETGQGSRQPDYEFSLRD